MRNKSKIKLHIKLNRNCNFFGVFFAFNKEIKQKRTQQFNDTVKEITGGFLTKVYGPVTEQENALENVAESVEDQKEARKAEEKKAKRKRIFNTIFMFVNIAVLVVVLTIQLTSEQITPFKDLIGVNLWYAFLIVLVFTIIMILDSARVNLLIKKSGHKSRPRLAYKTCAIGRYYDAITPMSSGGQTFQVFYLNARGINTSSSISVPIARYAFLQISWVLIALFALGFVFFNNYLNSAIMTLMAVVGFVVSIALLSLTLIISLNKKAGEKIICGILKLLSKIKIVKNFDETYKKVMNLVEGYQSTMHKYTKNKWLFCGLTFCSVLIYILHFSMPFLIYLFLGGKDFSVFMQMTTLAVIIELAAGFIPLPGGTGMNEISFPIMFATIYPEGTIVWAMLLWRFCNYYIYLIQGFGVILYDYFYGNKKYKWTKRKWELEAESISFEQAILANNKTKRKNKRIY